MSRLAFAFFIVAPIYALAGMAWGSYMGETNDHSMLAAHAHLNLVGWVTLALMGSFYALAGRRAHQALGWLNFLVSSLGALALACGMALWILADKHYQPVVITGSMSSMAGMLVFLIAVIVTAFRKPPAAAH